jgi:hypothetical protein
LSISDANEVQCRNELNSWFLASGARHSPCSTWDAVFITNAE